MPLLSKSLLTISTLLLTHSCYSAHEHASLPSSSSTSGLPLDVVLETLVATLLLSVGIVLSGDRGEKLRPVAMRVWNGKLERERGGGMFAAALEERFGFWDVRGKRAEFERWAKEGK